MVENKSLQEWLRKQAEESLEAAKTPLGNLADCYEALDVFLTRETPTFAETQRAYRHQLYRYDPSSPNLPPESVEYKTLMTVRIKEAYIRICAELGKNPEEGLTETEESLIAERDKLLEGWADHWCGTPSLNIQYEYKERIKALKEKGAVTAENEQYRTEP